MAKEVVCMHGYLTKKGMVFITNVHILHDQRVVAEPGDMLNIEGEVVKNLTRVRKSLPDSSFPLEGAAFCGARSAFLSWFCALTYPQVPALGYLN
jgi:hypothetical protein